MTKHIKLGGLEGSDAKHAGILKDEGLAATVSSYLDNRLSNKELEEFETLLKGNPRLAREVQEMRGIESQLKELGSEILFEPVPDALLEALAPLKQE